jgi:AcrR family transcriptional regulator
VEPGAEPERIARCVTLLLFDGITTAAGTYDDKAKPSRIVDEARRRWEAQADLRRAERRGEILDVALTEFAQRGFEATTTRDIADAAGIKASNLYRYFESKDSMFREILVGFSEDLLSAYREIISVGAGTAQTLDAILWLLNQAGRHFSREIELITSSRQLPAPGDRYYEGAAVRLTMLSELIGRGVADGELKSIDEPGLVAACLREIMWAPMKDLLLVSANRVRTFHRASVLSGLAR